MTVSKFFGILFYLILYPTVVYWLVVFLFWNEANNSWKYLWEHSIIFDISFVVSVCFSIFMFICFVIYVVHNSGRAITIAFSPKYIFNNFWADISNELN